jgi:hypothetical protein
MRFRITTIGISLAAFMTLGMPAISHAKDLSSQPTTMKHERVQDTGGDKSGKKAPKKKTDKGEDKGAPK